MPLRLSPASALLPQSGVCDRLALVCGLVKGPFESPPAALRPGAMLWKQTNWRFFPSSAGNWEGAQRLRAWRWAGWGLLLRSTSRGRACVQPSASLRP